MNTESIIQPDPEIKGERGPAMKGADVLVAALEREGVDTIFAYPGGASMELHQVCVLGNDCGYYNISNISYYITLKFKNYYNDSRFN